MMTQRVFTIIAVFAVICGSTGSAAAAISKSSSSSKSSSRSSSSSVSAAPKAAAPAKPRPAPSVASKPRSTVVPKVVTPKPQVKSPVKKTTPKPAGITQPKAAKKTTKRVSGLLAKLKGKKRPSQKKYNNVTSPYYYGVWSSLYFPFWVEDLVDGDADTVAYLPDDDDTGMTTFLRALPVFYEPATQ